MAFWTKVNPAVVKRYRDAVHRDVQYLRMQPYSGRPGVTDSRESVVSRTPFVIVYEVAEHEVIIQRFWHGAQDRPLRDDGRTLVDDE